jgi:hypothetical protein
MITGVYAVEVQHFADLYHYELHLLQEGLTVYGRVKAKGRSCSFFNGTALQSPGETEAHIFLFRNGEVDDYVDVKLPSGETVNLSPPGGYHVDGIHFGGTVSGDTVVATFTLQDALVISLKGTRIAGEPDIKRTFRTDTHPGKNLYCTCGTGTCTHRGFCDSCQIFEFLHAEGMPSMSDTIPTVPLCMTAQTNKLFGVTKEEAKKLFAAPPALEVNGEKRPAHGAHHLVDENYVYKL